MFDFSNYNKKVEELLFKFSSFFLESYKDNNKALFLEFKNIKSLRQFDEVLLRFLLENKLYLQNQKNIFAIFG